MGLYYIWSVKGLKLLFGVVIICFVNSAVSQTEPLYTQFFLFPQHHNPASVGANLGIDAGLIARFQYTGLTNRMISTQGFDFGIAIPSASSAIGLRVNNDFIGLQRSTWLGVQYVYRKKFRNWNLGAGLDIGFLQTSLDGSRMITPDGDYQPGSVNHQDNYLSNVQQNGIAPHFGIGLWFNNKSFFAGLSVQQLILTDAYFNSPAGKTKFKYSRIITLSGGYDFRLGSKLRLQPSLLIRSDFVKIQGDLNLKFTILDNILLGMSLRGYDKRSLDAVSGMVGYIIKKQYHLVYSYDGNISGLRKFNGGSHEVSFRMFFPLKDRFIEGYKYHIPRYL